MCGIHASISSRGYHAPTNELKLLLRKRGPDHVGEEKCQYLSDDGITRYISFTSTVLALRGGQITTQPFQDSASGCMLCWNGEAWAINSIPIVGNDGISIFEMLQKASSSGLSLAESTAATLKVLRSISGPFAFVFLDQNHGLLYFGRDCLGRRSLLLKHDANLSLLEISSCVDNLDSHWEEVEADGIHQISLNLKSHFEEEKKDKPTATSKVLYPSRRFPWENITDVRSHSLAFNVQSRLIRGLAMSCELTIS